MFKLLKGIILILLSFDFCSLCEQISTETGSMIRHELIHSGEKEPVCKFCGKSYTHGGNLKRHELIHTKRGNMSEIYVDKLLLRLAP